MNSTSYWRQTLAGIEMIATRTDRRLALDLGISLAPARRLLSRLVTRNGATAATSPATASDSLRQRVSQIEWYHTLDLGNGVRTPGAFDHAPYLHLYNLPASFAGLRVLDCATFDGYWAFEFERRGAKQVVALDIETVGDIDLPPRRRAELPTATLERPVGAGFKLAKEVLGSSVERAPCNLYDLSPSYRGLFDVVHIGDVLLHLADPLLALQNVRSVTGGYALISDCYWPELLRYEPDTVIEYFGGTGENAWWRPSEAALLAMIEDAGFRQYEVVSRHTYAERGYLSRMHHIVVKAMP